MTIILRSDRPATNNLGNVFGIKGPLDYAALLDFNQGIYRYRSGGSLIETTLQEAITFSRSTEGGYTDSNGLYQVAPANAPRIHHRSDFGVSGLLIEGATTNLLANPLAPVTQTIVVPSAGLQTCVVLSVEGTGSATLSGELSGIEALPAIQGRPQGAILVNPGSGNSNVTVTITGNVTRFQLEKCAQSTGGGYASTFVPTGVGTRSADLCTLSPAFASAALGSGNGTVVAQLIDHSRRPLGMLAVYNVMAVNNTTTPKGGVYASRNITNAAGNRQIGVKQINPGGSVIAKNISMAIPGGDANTYAMGWGNSGAYAGVAVNGGYQANVVAAPEQIPNNMIIGSTDGYTAGAAQAGGIFTRIVVYKRLLTPEELIQLSYSWN